MNIPAIVTDNNTVSALYTMGLIVVSVFFAGWVINTKLRKICAEDNVQLEKRIADMEAKLTKLEEDTVKLEVYDKDINRICDMVSEMKEDMKDTLKSVTTRIDALSLLFTRDQFGSRS